MRYSSQEIPFSYGNLDREDQEGIEDSIREFINHISGNSTEDDAYDLHEVLKEKRTRRDDTLDGLKEIRDGLCELEERLETEYIIHEEDLEHTDSSYGNIK